MKSTVVPLLFAGICIRNGDSFVVPNHGSPGLRIPKRTSSTDPSHYWKKLPSLEQPHNSRSIATPTTSTRAPTTSLNMMKCLPTQIMADALSSIDQEQAELIAGPLFGASLFPYLAFLYFLNVDENDFPKGVTVGFATCLVFVFLTIPAAIAAKVWYGVSLADSDWLHGSAESLLTMTNLVTVVAFRQALQAKTASSSSMEMPVTATSYAPTIWWVVILTALAGVTAFVPGLTGAVQHTPYLNGFMDIPAGWMDLPGQFGAHPEPENALTIATWIIHSSSLVEFLVAMGFCWRWADVVGNPTWKGLTWGLLPLHSSGITACTYHFFYNQIPVLVPFQAFLTCFGNTTAAYAALRIALSNGWKPPAQAAFLSKCYTPPPTLSSSATPDKSSSSTNNPQESASLVGFEDLGDALEGDTDYTFLLKLFAGCAVVSYGIKYGETFFDFPYEADTYLGFTFVLVPSTLNAFKWWKRSRDPTFEGWF